MKRLSVLGSTGSVGVSTLRVARHLGCKVVALAAHSNIELLEEQARRFSPSVVAVFDEEKAGLLQKRLPGLSVRSGMEGLLEAASLQEADLVVSAIVGTRGILPTVAAIDAGKDVALANKETLVSAGQIVMDKVRENRVALLPIDSEHSALFQCLQTNDAKEVRRLILTASGGPFLHFDEKRLASVTVEQALAHPKWRMGRKISVDSSTLMNKGLEVLEAHWLFGIPLKQIEVVIHPQSIVHSMVEFVDGSVIAQLSAPNMTLPIQYALTYPKRKPGLIEPLDFSKLGTLTFFPPDLKRFFCLALAYLAAEGGKSKPGYLNAANEVLVGRFLQKQIGWREIAEKLEALLEGHAPRQIKKLDDVFAVDTLARQEAARI